MRFYDINSGKLAIDDLFAIWTTSRHHHEMDLEWCFKKLWLQTGTVRENITRKSNASEEEMIRIAKLCHIHGLQWAVCQGYDTVISMTVGTSHKGKNNCLHRACDDVQPNMLILDEATSSIDTRTELKIQEAFQRSTEGRTSFIVAHRLSTESGARKRTKTRCA